VLSRRLRGSINLKRIRIPHSHVGNNKWLLLNPESVGCPAYDDPSAPAHVSEAGSPHARYALLDFSHGEGRGDDAEMTFVALSYAHEQAACRAEANGRADWAHALRTGTMPPVPAVK